MFAIDRQEYRRGG